MGPGGTRPYLFDATGSTGIDIHPQRRRKRLDLIHALIDVTDRHRPKCPLRLFFEGEDRITPLRDLFVERAQPPRVPQSLLRHDRGPLVEDPGRTKPIGELAHTAEEEWHCRVLSK